MRLSRFFITRPIFAAVIAIIITIVGGLAYLGLPVSQYPNIVPPTVTVTAAYPGASAETVAETVAAPIEQEINGVDNMIYQSSQSTGDGRVVITVTFAQGTDLDEAQVLVHAGAFATHPEAGYVSRHSPAELCRVVNPNERVATEVSHELFVVPQRGAQQIDAIGELEFMQRLDVARFGIRNGKPECAFLRIEALFVDVLLALCKACQAQASIAEERVDEFTIEIPVHNGAECAPALRVGARASPEDG